MVGEPKLGGGTPDTEEGTWCEPGPELGLQVPDGGSMRGPDQAVPTFAHTSSLSSIHVFAVYWVPTP